MSLILWEYFWTAADWVPGSASATATVSLSTTYIGAGGGHKHGGYNRLNEDFWEIREQHLRTHVEPILRKVIPLELEIPTAEPDTPLEDDQLYVLQFKRNAALRRAYSATNEIELYGTANRVIKLTLDISNYISQYYAQAAIILLFDLF